MFFEVRPTHILAAPNATRNPDFRAFTKRYNFQWKVSKTFNSDPSKWRNCQYSTGFIMLFEICSIPSQPSSAQPAQPVRPAPASPASPASPAQPSKFDQSYHRPDKRRQKTSYWRFCIFSRSNERPNFAKIFKTMFWHTQVTSSFLQKIDFFRILTVLTPSSYALILQKIIKNRHFVIFDRTLITSVDRDFPHLPPT